MAVARDGAQRSRWHQYAAAEGAIVNLNVVVGVKEHQRTALRFAAQEAIERHANLRIVHCLDIRTPTDSVSVPSAIFLPESWRAAGEAVLDEARAVVNELDLMSDPVCVLSDRPPFQTLRDEAADASMVVVGVDAAGLYGPLLGGNVARRLITQSAVPVAIVPERPWPDEMVGPIFVAIDNRTPAEGPLRFAFAEASKSTNELHVAHVIPENATMCFRSQSDGLEMSEVLAGWCEEFPDVKITHRFFFDEADEGCVRVSEEASLLVLGRREGKIFGHSVLIDIAKRVHCPCVVVPDEWNAR
jgi:nucleotide-binding universal stress UspA family protein